MITTRSIVIEDYKFINEWWIGWGENHAPSLGDLPNRGLSGVIVEKDNKPIAANYIYLTNSNMAYLANAISDPSYKSKDRLEIIQVLLNECVRRAEALGCTFVWCTSNEKGVIKRCKDAGFVVSEKQNIITKIIK